jgi:hypothetical protein
MIIFSGKLLDGGSILPDIFTVTLPSNWESRWPEIEAAAHKYNFSVERKGDEIAFSGYGIIGDIRVDGTTAHVTIDKKPFFLSTAYIADKVENFLKGQR